MKMGLRGTSSYTYPSADGSLLSVVPQLRWRISDTDTRPRVTQDAAREGRYCTVTLSTRT
jgi:hypothetical protein